MYPVYLLRRLCLLIHAWPLCLEKWGWKVVEGRNKGVREKEREGGRERKKKGERESQWKDLLLGGLSWYNTSTSRRRHGNPASAPTYCGEKESVSVLVCHSTVLKKKKTKHIFIDKYQMLNKYVSRIQTMFYLTNRYSAHPWAQAHSRTVQWRLRSIEISWLFIAPCIFQGPWADRGLWTQLKSSGEKLLPSVPCLLKINWILKSKEKRYKATSSQSHTKREREGGMDKGGRWGAGVCVGVCMVLYSQVCPSTDLTGFKSEWRVVRSCVNAKRVAGDSHVKITWGYRRHHGSSLPLNFHPQT